jgi:hypothetical protein
MGAPEVLLQHACCALSGLVKDCLSQKIRSRASISGADFARGSSGPCDTYWPVRNILAPGSFQKSRIDWDFGRRPASAHI